MEAILQVRLSVDSHTISFDLSAIVSAISSALRESYSGMTDEEYEAYMDAIEAEREDVAKEARRAMRLFLQTIIRRKLKYLKTAAAIKSLTLNRLRSTQRVSQGDPGTEALAASMPTPPTYASSLYQVKCV